ncbi:FmtA-like protein [Rhodospirillales bacterium TMPK1]|uniref:FmtA-like protein n=2 Tax=Roseiterribacter gracilis TaxID=2812848 RepID=A0A8S8XBE6_9PROT|nr:FmtA-like protein [Rhodospirillales bacterium TMPK1]
MALACVGALACAGVATAQQSPSVPPPAPKTETQGPTDTANPAVRPLTAADAEVWLDGYMPYALQKGDVAGAVVVIVKDGKVLLQKGYGYADVAAKTPVDPERTAFRPGSVSKLFVWTAVMQLVEQGKLDLDKDVNTYLDFKIPADGWDKPVTLRNILTHTGGFEESNKGLITSNIDNTGLEKVLKRYIPARVYAPGSTPAYSNWATGLAGYIIQRVSGKTFDDYLDQAILQPLGMTNSSFRQPLPEHVMKLMSKGYVQGSAPPRPYEIVSLAPAGSLAATGADMGKFMIAHLQDGTFNGAQILKPETAKMMHNTPYTVLPVVNRMELGFYEHDVNGHRVISHGGDTTMFHSELNLFLDDNVGIFFSANSTGRDGGVGPVRAELLQKFGDRYFPGEFPGANATVEPATAAQHAQMIAGTYDVSRRFHTTFLAALRLFGQTKVVANPDNTITIVGSNTIGGAPKKWVETAPFVWRDKDGKTRLSAKVEGNQVVRYSFDGVSPFMMWDRTPVATSTRWIQPVLIGSMVALALTVLLWPVQALVRRNYRAPFALRGQAAQSYRAMRIVAVLNLLVWYGWFTMTSALGYSANPADHYDGRLTLLQIAGWLFFVGTVVIAAWNAQQVFTGNRSLFAKIWSVVLVVASLVIFYVAFTFKLLVISTLY